MSNFFKTEAVIFDMDGVLVDSEPLWENAEAQVLADLGIDRTSMLEKLNISFTGMKVNDVIDVFCQFAPEKNIDAHLTANKMIDLAIEQIIAAKPILPGVVEALELCHSLGLKVGLASSSAMRVIDAVTETLNIRHFFDTRVSAEHLPFGKPHPDVYLLAAKNLAVSPTNCITIEDSIAGMISTKAARMKSIVVPAKHDSDKPQWCLADHKLSSLLELTENHFR